MRAGIMSFALAILATAAGARAEENATPSTEIVALRSEHAETFAISGGTQRVTNIYAGKKYWGDQGGLTPVTRAPVEESRDGFTRAVHAGPYTARFDPEHPGKGMRFERGDYRVAYAPYGAWANRETRFEYTAEGVKETVVMSPGSDPAVAWTVKTNAGMALIGGATVFTDSLGRDVFRSPRFVAWDSTFRDIPVRAALVGNRLTCRLDVPEDAVWPVYLDPTVGIGENDAETATLYAYGDDYTTAHNAGVADGYYQTTLRAGTVMHDVGVDVYRGALAFEVTPFPRGAIIDSAAVSLLTDYVETTLPIHLKLVSANFTGPVCEEWFNDFPGWTPGTGYSVLSMSATVPVSGSVGDTCRFVLNGAGRDFLANYGTARYMLLCEEDINGAYETSNNLIGFDISSPVLTVWYHLPIAAPSDFVMTIVDSTTIHCSWTDRSANEQRFYIVNAVGTPKVDSTAADVTTKTISGLSMNTRYIWMAAADSGGVRVYSNADTLWTPLNPPLPQQVRISPISSDTLRVAVVAPPNANAGMTGMEVRAVSGPGATGSGVISGLSSWRDGGVTPDSSYVYAVRYRGGDGAFTGWSPDIRYTMRGRAVVTLGLPGDAYDDYTANSSAGVRDSTVIRAGRTAAGTRLDGFFSFNLPWEVRTGGVDSLFLSLTRVGELSGTAPALSLYSIPVANLAPVETLTLGAQDSSVAGVPWSVTAGAGQKRSPNLRAIFREWQDCAGAERLVHGFGMRLDDHASPAGVQAVFLDSSNPSYSGGTELTVYYTPGHADTLIGLPSGFVLSPCAPDSIRADWTDTVSGEYGYLLLNRADSSRVAGTDTLAANVTGTTVGGLAPNTAYEWMVQAITPERKKASSVVGARTFARIPGRPVLTPLSSSKIRFVLDSRDNPAHTEYAVQDSASGWYVDADAVPHVLRQGPSGAWSWRTFAGWGGAQGDTLTTLAPGTKYGLRAKAR